MKPLVLEWRQPFTDRLGNEWLVWGDTCIRPEIADEFASMKRFTGAELAAEHWHSVAREAEAELRSRQAAMDGLSTTADHYQRINWVSAPQTEALYRFATLPHYDEVP